MRATESTTDPHMTLDALSEAIAKAGLEIYRVEHPEIRIAQRVRMHLMDSNVAILIAPSPQVVLTVRAQRSDFPTDSESELFERVRAALSEATQARGYAEASATARDILKPGDESDVLDVWHELTFAKPIDDVTALIAELRWALSVSKCIDP